MEGRTIKDSYGNEVGILRGAVFYMNVSKRELVLQIGSHGGWAVDYDVLFDSLPERGSIYITNRTDKTLYMANNAAFKEYGEVIRSKNSYGGEDIYSQVVLPVEYFKKVKNGV